MTKNKILYENAFTLSEVLLVILILGVVAILVLPMLKKRVDTREYEMARKKMEYTFQQAVTSIATNYDLRGATSAEDFVENYLKRQIPMIQTCTNENLKKCGIETSNGGIFTYEETKKTMPVQKNQLTPYTSSTDKSYGFTMSNGYSVNLFYNPNCKTWETAAYQVGSAGQAVCINVIYDMNGLKGPNQIGKDIGTITVVDPIQPIAASLNILATAGKASSTCKGGRLPTYSEATAYTYNMSLYTPSITTSCRAKTSTVDNGLPLVLFCNGGVHWGESFNSICLKNN